MFLQITNSSKLYNTICFLLYFAKTKNYILQFEAPPWDRLKCAKLGQNIKTVFSSFKHLERGLKMSKLTNLFDVSFICKSVGNVTSSIRNFWPTNFPTNCNIGPSPAVYVCIIWLLKVRLRQFLGRALRLGQARGPSAAWLGLARGPDAATTSPYSNSKTTCYSRMSDM